MRNNYIISATILALLTSCVAKDLDPRKLDPAMKADYQQLKDKILPEAENKDETEKSQEAMIPSMAPIIAPPPEPMVGKDKLVSISITDDVPLKEVFIEISRLADIDIEIDPNIKGGVILRARNKPFSEVIDRICDLSSLRYSNKGGILRIENDTPFLVNYNLDFLNIVRSNSGSTGLSTALSGSSSGGGSTTNLKSSYENDLWGEIEKDINKILSQNSSSKPAAAATATATATATAADSSSNDGNSYISINKQASLVGIFATNKQQRMIKSYLEKVRDAASAQVLIEAKIVDIALNDGYQSGVNWNAITNKENASGGFGFTQTTPSIDTTNGALSMGIFNKRSNIIGLAAGTGLTPALGLQELVQLSQTFGSTRTLASPRIHAMNNQQAVLSFVTNQVYFSVTVQNNAGTTSTSGGSTSTSGSQITVNSTSHTVPIGIILTLQPSINLDTNEITMNIRPSITSTNSNVQDPAVLYAIAQGGSSSSSGSSTPSLSSNVANVPIVNVKELDSILKIKSGEIMVIGGMMQDSSVNADKGVPLLMSIPIFGNMFKTVSKINTTTQTVIFIQATVVPTDRISKKDRNTYNNFVIDKEVKI